MFWIGTALLDSLLTYPERDYLSRLLFPIQFAGVCQPGCVLAVWQWGFCATRSPLVARYRRIGASCRVISSSALFVPGEVLLVSTLRICRSSCAIKFAQHAQNAPKLAFLRLLGELFRENAAGVPLLGELCRARGRMRLVLGACCRAQGAGAFFCVTGVLRWFQSDCDTGIFSHVAATRTRPSV